MAKDKELRAKLDKELSDHSKEMVIEVLANKIEECEYLRQTMARMEMALNKFNRLEMLVGVIKLKNVLNLDDDFVVKAKEEIQNTFYPAPKEE